MNKPILCCLKIKSATLLIGVLDLILHTILLATLFASFSHPDVFDHYYANSLSLVASSSSCLSTSVPMSSQKSDLSNSGVLPQSNQDLNPIHYNSDQQLPPQKFRIQVDSYASSHQLTGSNNSNMFLPRDKSIVLLVTTFSTFITIMLICGIIKNKPSYLMPYFSIKVFQVVMACLTTLGFYSCLPNVRYWIQTRNYIPFKNTILFLDNQTLELFAFSILLTSILVKLYTVIIVWYCYRYMITIESFRNTNSLNACASTSFDESSNGYKIDDESLSINQPPKYEDIMKQLKQEKKSSAIINTSNLNGASTSSANCSRAPAAAADTSAFLNNNINEELSHSDSEPSTSSSVQLPSYIAATSNKIIL